jgi:hypothetical protein
MSLSPIGSSTVAKPRKVPLAIGFHETSRIFGRWAVVPGRGLQAAASPLRSSASLGRAIIGPRQRESEVAEGNHHRS